jgi:hypothetical protein
MVIPFSFFHFLKVAAVHSLGASNFDLVLMFHDRDCPGLKAGRGLLDLHHTLGHPFHLPERGCWLTVTRDFFFFVRRTAGSW